MDGSRRRLPPCQPAEHEEGDHRQHQADAEERDAPAGGDQPVGGEVGDGPEVKVVSLQAGDRFLLCTDGLTGVVTDEQILNYVRDQTDVQACADGLGQLALDSGSKDNVSCIVIEVADRQ